ncbi:MAG: TetR/AcrR family transcriptional regulator [Lachnospiraceae bacterium]
MEKKTDLRIIKTQKALCDTFLEMLNEKKFEEITVNELCERALVRRATFYKHFADKYEFFGFFIRQIQERFIADIRQYQGEGDPVSYYIYLFRHCIRFLEENRGILTSVLKSNAFPALLEIFLDEVYRNVLLQMKEHEREGVNFPVEVEILASFYTGGIVQILRYWFTKEETMTEEEIVEKVEIILRKFRLED